MYTVFKTHKIQVLFERNYVGYIQTWLVRKILSWRKKAYVHCSCILIFIIFFFGFLSITLVLFVIWNQTQNFHQTSVGATDNWTRPSSRKGSKGQITTLRYTRNPWWVSGYADKHACIKDMANVPHKRNKNCSARGMPHFNPQLMCKAVDFANTQNYKQHNQPTIIFTKYHQCPFLIHEESNLPRKLLVYSYTLFKFSFLSFC